LLFLFQIIILPKPLIVPVAALDGSHVIVVLCVAIKEPVAPLYIVVIVLVQQGAFRQMNVGVVRVGHGIPVAQAHYVLATDKTLRVLA